MARRSTGKSQHRPLQCSGSGHWNSQNVCQGNRSRPRLRLKHARLRLTATLEDVEFRHPPGLDKSLVISMAGRQWIREHHDVLSSGSGKSYLTYRLSLNSESLTKLRKHVQE